MLWLFRLASELIWGCATLVLHVWLGVLVVARKCPVLPVSAISFMSFEVVVVGGPSGCVVVEQQLFILILV
jgi:hypothetical protein